jgi:PAS domain S-box-containing protein
MGGERSIVVEPSGVERTFGDEEIIVSKTDRAGRITYANDVFVRVAGYTEAELLGKPHSIIRHPDMPRCVFKLLWDTIEAREEIFAYVLNMAKNGDHYWVFAHVTPTFDARGEIVGYHSNRRSPEKAPLERAKGLYARLLETERGHEDRREGLGASTELLTQVLARLDTTYEELMFAP